MWTRVGRYHGNSIIICVGNNRTAASSTLSVYRKLDNRACAVLDGRGTNAHVREWLQEMATSLSKLNLVMKKNVKSVVRQYFGQQADEKNIPKTRAGRSACLQEVLQTSTSEAWQHFEFVISFA